MHRNLWTADTERLFGLFLNMETANALFTFMVTYTDSMNMKMILDVLVLDTYMYMCVCIYIYIYVCVCVCVCVCVLKAGNLCEFVYSTALCINFIVT